MNSMKYIFSLTIISFSNRNFQIISFSNRNILESGFEYIYINNKYNKKSNHYMLDYKIS